MTFTEFFLILMPSLATLLGGIALLVFKRKFKKYEKYEALKEKQETRKYNKIVLTERKIDCLIFALTNVNGQFKPISNEIQKLYDQHWRRLDREEEILENESIS